MVGEKFGKLTVVEVAGKGPRGFSWWCTCGGCGKRIRLTSSELKNEGYKTCGCGVTHHDKVAPTPKKYKQQWPSTYVTWHAMLARCYFSKSKEEGCYRNIEVCERWFTFINFVKDMGPRPSREHSIDRKDPDKGYYKENCHWVTKSFNCSNVRRNVSPERNKRVSEGLKRGYAEGRIVFTAQQRQGIAKGGITRTGRKLQPCTKCGDKAYLPLCRFCRGKRR